MRKQWISSTALVLLSSVVAVGHAAETDAPWMTLARASHSCRMLEGCAGTFPKCVSKMAAELASSPASQAIERIDRYCVAHIADALPGCKDPQPPPVPPVNDPPKPAAITSTLIEVHHRTPCQVLRGHCPARFADSTESETVEFEIPHVPNSDLSKYEIFSPSEVNLVEATSGAPLPVALSFAERPVVASSDHHFRLRAQFLGLTEAIDAKTSVVLRGENLPEMNLDLRLRAVDPFWMRFVLPVLYLLIALIFDLRLVSSRRSFIVARAAAIVNSVLQLPVRGTDSAVTSLCSKVSDMVDLLRSSKIDEANAYIQKIDDAAGILRNAWEQSFLTESRASWQEKLSAKSDELKKQLKQSESHLERLKNAATDLESAISNNGADSKLARQAAFRARLILDRPPLLKSLRALLGAFSKPQPEETALTTSEVSELQRRLQDSLAKSEEEAQSLRAQIRSASELSRDLGANSAVKLPPDLQRKLEEAVGTQGGVSAPPPVDPLLAERVRAALASLEYESRVSWPQRILTGLVSLLVVVIGIGSGLVGDGYASALLAAVTASQALRAGVGAFEGVARAVLQRA